MPIKISKVIKDLNVGKLTLQEFLRKRGVEIEDNINARIDDKVYEMLVKEFRPDLELKAKADDIAKERQKEKAKQNEARKVEEIKTTVPGQKPTFLGKIDLATGKPITEEKPEPTVAEVVPAPVAEPKPAPEAKSEPEPVAEVKPEPAAEPKPEVKPEPKVEPEAKPEPQKAEPKPQPKAAKPKAQAKPKAEPEAKPEPKKAEVKPAAKAETQTKPEA